MNDLPTRDSAAVNEGTESRDVRLWLAAIVDSSADAIISKDLDGVILTWNRAAERLFGYSEEEAVGQPITFIIPPELHDKEKDILERLRNGERIEHYETKRLARDGRFLDVSLTISPVRDARGVIVGASKILRNITESKRAQATLREYQQRLEREVTGSRTLQSISTRLIPESKQEALFVLILDAAMELMVADAASLQMLAPDGKSLTLLGCRNFHPDSAAFWQRVAAEASTTFGVAFRNKKRVLVTDVESCQFLAGTQDLQECRRSGIRAVQSTPLQSRVGRPLGMLSTHWREPHTPTEGDFRLFDVLAGQAADLIERTLAEDAVRESEERFRLISNTAPVIIWMSNAEKQCTYVNQTWIDLTGQSFHAALGTGWASPMHPDDVARSWDTFARAFERREQFQIEYRLRGQDGQFRWIVGSGVPRFNADGSFAGYIGSAVDVTEHKLAAENQERFRSVFEYSAVGMALVSYDGRWMRVNRALCEMLGYSEQELLATNFQSLTHPDDLEADLSYAQKVFTGQVRCYHMEKRYIHKQGHVVWVTLTASAVPDASGKVSYGVAQVQDITARKNVEAALRRDQEELQSLAGRLITVQEEERRRIARDLHDDLSQRLALLCVDLDMLRQSLADGAEAGRELERMRRETDELVVDMRRLSHDEHHPQLALGLEHGVASFCRGFSRKHGIAVKVVHEGDLKQIPETVCFSLFRVLQEAMSNVAKHSRADRVTVTLGVHGNQALLRVTDEGRGFEIGSDRGLGLISMRERMRLVGGTMRVNSSPLQGTDVEAAAPLPISLGAAPASS